MKSKFSVNLSLVHKTQDVVSTFLIDIWHRPFVLTALNGSLHSAKHPLVGCQVRLGSKVPAFKPFPTLCSFPSMG